MKSECLEIIPDFDTTSGSCLVAIKRVLAHLEFDERLPAISWTPLLDPPFDLSFFLCCRSRATTYRFFYEMVSRWLIPGKRMSALMQFVADFTIPELGRQKYLAGEVTIRIENRHELDVLKRNLSRIESEIKLGVESYYQSCRILEIKGLSVDEKTALIQESLLTLIRHRPQDFDFDLLSEMQHFLALCKESFKAERTFRHISRIICVHYLFRHALKLSLESFPDRRYISVKLMRTRIGSKRAILGIAIAVSFIRDHEILEERHILSSIQGIIPGVRAMEGSFFRNQEGAFYLEVDQEGGISIEEQRRLKKELPTELKNRFEMRLNPVFMPQNEEMVIRNIVSLSQQLKFIRDLPQVMIDFSHQTKDHLEFLVIALRVVTPKLGPISTYFERKPTFLKCIPDRVKIVGSIRKKYQKEATVFRLQILKHPFLRKNHAIDLYKARKEMACELARLIGEFRDYNGGIISKETELFDHLKSSLGKVAVEHAFILENYFYSLTPPIMRSVLPVEPLKKLFAMLVEEKLEDQSYTIRIQEDANYLYALVTSIDPHFHQNLSLEAYEGRVATCFVSQRGCFSFGLVVRDPSTQDSLKLRLAIEEIMNL